MTADETALLRLCDAAHHCCDAAMTSGVVLRCWESLLCSFTLSSLSPSNSRERPGAVDRAVAIASASQILVTAHLRYGQGIGPVSSVLAFKQVPFCTQGLFL
jgi:hypothetical protein